MARHLGTRTFSTAESYHDLVTLPDVVIQYEGRLHDLQAGLAHARYLHAASAFVLASAVAVFMMLSVYAIRQQVAFWWPSVPIPVVAASARRYTRYRRTRTRMTRLRRFYTRALGRVRGNWAGIGISGEEFADSEHVYSRDLHIFGEGSLFELLCIARTAIGQRGLAGYLLAAPPVEETLLRQKAVREVQRRTDVRDQLAVLGAFDFSESKSETFETWLALPPFRFSRILRFTALVTSSVVAILLLAGISAALPRSTITTWIAPLVLFHMGVGLIFRQRVNRMIEPLRSLSFETRVLREGLELMERTEWESDKLKFLASRVQNASRSVRNLERLLNGLNERNKEWFYFPSLLLLLGTQLCMAVEQWRVENGAALQTWLDAWAEFEALNALAGYAHENPANTFPEFSASDDARFEAQALGHPLLAEEACVTNDVYLNPQSHFYVVSGSNMSGKSTLLRAIGLNAVLASAGAPVRARSLRLSKLSVCASLSVVDSLLHGKSKFLAEVDRLRQTIASAEGNPVLFLIDEILSGTNSHDRRVAAEAVVRTLIDRGAIGALSTHDLALTEIAEAEGLHGVNVHMGSRDGSDPMDFDYRLKLGVTTESNALAIARMAGVAV
jgi:DNA mismatch repair ATPase MutS